MSKQLRKPNLASFISGPDTDEPAPLVETASAKPEVAAEPEPVEVAAAPVGTVLRMAQPAKTKAAAAAPPVVAAKARLVDRAKQETVYLEPAVRDQLLELAFTERKKKHALMLEALDLLFKNRGLKSIAQLTAK